LRGVLAADYLTGYTTEDRRADVYAPLTGPGWVPSEPIRYVLHFETHNLDNNHKPALPADFLSGEVSPFPGKLSASTPVIVREEFRDHGLKLAHGYRVLDWMELPDNKVPSKGRFDDAILSGVGSFLTTGLVFFVLVKVRGTAIDIFGKTEIPEVR